jgi:hypothetical protein
MTDLRDHNGIYQKFLQETAAMIFMDDLAKRLANRVQLTSDGHKAYLEAVEGAFGSNIDYAMLVKVYGPASLQPCRVHRGGKASRRRQSRSQACFD